MPIILTQLDKLSILTDKKKRLSLNITKRQEFIHRYQDEEHTLHTTVIEFSVKEEYFCD